MREIVDEAIQRVRALRLGGEHGDRKLECHISEGCVGLWDGVRITRAVRW